MNSIILIAACAVCLDQLFFRQRALIFHAQLVELLLQVLSFAEHGLL